MVIEFVIRNLSQIYFCKLKIFQMNASNSQRLFCIKRAGVKFRNKAFWYDNIFVYLFRSNIWHLIQLKNKTKSNTVHIIVFGDRSNPAKVCFKSAPYLHQKKYNWALNMLLFMLWCCIINSSQLVPLEDEVIPSILYHD